MKSTVHVVTTVEKSATTELRVSLTTWRGAHKVELHECTAIISGVFLPTGSFVSIDLSRLAALISALQLARANSRDKHAEPLQKFVLARLTTTCPSARHSRGPCFW
jgi:hypothetical protein